MGFGLLLIIILLAIATFNSLILVFKRDKYVSKYKFLYISLFFYNFCLVIYYVWYEAGYIGDLPQLMRTLSPLIYLCAPFIFFFVRNKLYRSTGLKKTDWIHFLPAILHFLDLLPFYLESVQMKSDFAAIIISDQSKFNLEAGGFIPIQFHYLFRIILQTVYFIYSIYLVNKIQPELFSLSKWKNFLSSDLVIILICMGWLVFFQFVYAVIESLIYLNAIDLTAQNYYLRRTSLIGLFGLNIFVNFKLGFGSEKKVKNKSNLKKEGTHNINLLQVIKPENIEEDEQLETDISANISQAETELIKFKIIAKLKDEEFYTEIGLTLNQFASQVDISPKLVSLVINKEFKTNFKDFLNQHRIAYAITKIEGGYLDHYTLVALGEMSGFNSRTTFFNAFKKCQGCSPSEYWKNFQNMV
jgi:AraC-like DNA-binding protein